MVPWTPATMIARLATDPDRGIRRRAAGHPNCPAGPLGRLAVGERHNPNTDLAEPVASNPNTSQQVLAELAAKPAAIRRRVAANPSTPPEVLARLGVDHTQSVSDAALSNPNIPVQLLDRLGRRSLERLAGGKDPAYTSESTCRAIAVNPSCPPALMLMFVESPHPAARGAVARNPVLPTRLVRQLASDPEGVARWGAAANPNCPRELLASLADDPDTDLRVAVAGNPSTPPEVITRLMQTSGEPWVVTAIAANPSTPPEILASVSGHGDQIVRLNVANNLSTPAEVLERLRTGDKSSDVRAAARRSLLCRR